MAKRVAILISGGGSNMLALLQAMAGDEAAIPALVLSNRPAAGGIAKARAEGVPVEILDHVAFGEDRQAFEAALHDTLLAAEVDLVCLAGFMRILSAEFTRDWAGKILNIHPSLLPKFKGLHTHARAIAAAETHHGCSVHIVTASLDDGPILGQARCRIAPDDDANSLQKRVLTLEHQLYPKVLARFVRGDRTPVFLDG